MGCGVGVVAVHFVAARRCGRRWAGWMRVERVGRRRRGVRVGMKEKERAAERVVKVILKLGAIFWDCWWGRSCPSKMMVKAGSDHTVTLAR